jgi:hypothetical protein
MRVLIVSRTLMTAGLCIGGIGLPSGRPLRLLPPQENHQPLDSPLRIGEIWEMKIKLRSTPAPFVEDCDAEAVEMLGRSNVRLYVASKSLAVTGSTEEVFDGRLEWTPQKGYLDPDSPTNFSTQFWRPDSKLRRYEGYRPGQFVFWEPETKRRIPWVGMKEAPETIEDGQLARLSLSRPFPGKLDRPVCWLQLSGVF